MSASFFGQHLLARGLITARQLLEAMELQESNNLRLGLRAVEAGLMTPAQVSQVHLMQRKVDRQFGELAIECGFLDLKAVESLLSKQRADHLLLSQALVRMGVFDEAAIAGHLEAYAQSRSAVPAPATIYQGLPNAEILSVITEVTLKMFARLAHSNLRPGPCHGAADLVSRDCYAAEQTLSGSLDVVICLNLSHGMVRRVASKMLETEIEELDADAIECCGEFINVVSGSIAGHLSTSGHQIELAPPEVHLFDSSPFWRERRRITEGAPGDPALGRLTVTPLRHPLEIVELCAAL
jgi:CheY-specific phosphatase CheX